MPSSDSCFFILKLSTRLKCYFIYTSYQKTKKKGSIRWWRHQVVKPKTSQKISKWFLKLNYPQLCIYLSLSWRFISWCKKNISTKLTRTNTNIFASMRKRHQSELNTQPAPKKNCLKWHKKYFCSFSYDWMIYSCQKNSSKNIFMTLFFQLQL